MSSFDTTSKSSIPIVDVSALFHNSVGSDVHNATIAEIGKACRNVGFFYVSNHNVTEELIKNLTLLSQAFFNQDVAIKNEICMAKGGKAWRGFFPVGDEVTSGIPDQKEGIYFGSNLTSSDPRPLHGPNIYPENICLPGDKTWTMKYAVEKYMTAVQTLGAVLMQAIALSLGLDEHFFTEYFSQEPTTLFRIFNYPPHAAKFGDHSFGVGEHTDYGYITILYQDHQGGLEVKNIESNTWTTAPPVAGTFVINLGDALEHMTGGLVRATPHRVRKREGATEDRLSFPFFYDPNFDSEMFSIVDRLSPEDVAIAARNRQQQQKQSARGVIVNANSSSNSNSNSSDASETAGGGGYRRWDCQEVTSYSGTYGSYLLRKVGKVFPDLASTAL